ncbi:Ribonuclease P protein component [Bienertia sinuspersici]
MKEMKKFYQKRKSHSNKTTVVHGHQIPLYGGMSFVSNAREGNSLHTDRVNVGLNLTFAVRSRAYILGRLVKSKFYKKIRCPVTLHGTHLGKPMNLLHSCVYE